MPTCLTLYTFSRENWKRPVHEVEMLMKFLELHLKSEEKNLVENNIRFRPIGRLDDLPKGVRRVIDGLISKTAANTGMVLQLALSYSGREELTRAAAAIARLVLDGSLNPDEITEEAMSERTFTPRECPTRTCSYARAERTGSPTSSSGSSLILRFT